MYSDKQTTKECNALCSHEREASDQFSSVESLSRVQLFATP